MSHRSARRRAFFRLLQFGATAVAWAAALVPLRVAAQSAGALTLEAESAQQYYRENAANEIYVQARVRASDPGVATAAVADAAAGVAATDAPAAPPPARADSITPVRNIAFVLDRSGSMDGERIEGLQKAVAAALDSLADADVVSIVLFSSEVETVIEAGRCDQARARFSELGPIEATGGAALYDALSQGAAQLRRFAQPASINQLILVTDGPATKGPRERADFVRLAGTLARERISIAAVGLGEECEEDVLAAVARTTAGRFVFARDASYLAEILSREIPPAQPVVATDVVLTLEYRSICDKVAAHGARSAEVVKNTVTCRFPRLLAGQELSVVASGVLDAFGTIGTQRDLVRVRLRWNDPASGEARELTQGVTIRFSLQSWDIADLYSIRVYRAAASARITEGLQDAIDALDRNDPRRALRELRYARDQVRDINFKPKDAEIAALIARIDGFITEVQARGLNPLDRKILRSGLLGQFEMPVPKEEEGAARP